MASAEPSCSDRLTGRRRPRSGCRSFVRVLLHGLCFDLDLHAVRDQNAAGLERLVPAQPPLTPIDLRPGGESGALFTPRILADSFEGGVEGDRHALPSDLELASNLEAVVLLLVGAF